MSSSEEQFLNTLGRRLAVSRKNAGLTQEALAASSGVDRVAIAYIETGKRRPSVTTLFRLTRSLEVKLTDLLAGF